MAGLCPLARGLNGPIRRAHTPRLRTSRATADWRQLPMSHPNPNGPAATRPWRVGDELWNPVTRERAVLLETPLDNVVGRARAEMTALVGSRVLGEGISIRADRAFHGRRGPTDRPAGREDRQASPGRDVRGPCRPVARLVECRGPRRAGDRGGGAGRAVRAHAGDAVRPRRDGTRGPEGDADTCSRWRSLAASSPTRSSSGPRRRRCRRCSSRRSRDWPTRWATARPTRAFAVVAGAS